MPRNAMLERQGLESGSKIKEFSLLLVETVAVSVSLSPPHSLTHSLIVCVSTHQGFYTQWHTPERSYQDCSNPWRFAISFVRPKTRVVFVLDWWGSRPDLRSGRSIFHEDEDEQRQGLRQKLCSLDSRRKRGTRQQNWQSPLPFESLDVEEEGSDEDSEAVAKGGVRDSVAELGWELEHRLPCVMG